MSLFTPFVHRSKAGLMAEAARVDTPFAQTWSYYKGREHHCGHCGTCVERREAFHLADVEDPTIYEDPNFWVAATAQKEIA